MSWVKVNTYNLSDRFQELMVQEIYKFHQITTDFNDYSRAIWIQNERDELNYSIKTVFDEMREWLGFYPRPIWKKIKVPLDKHQIYFNQDMLKIPESAWLNAIGERATSVIQGGVSIPSKGTTDEYVELNITTTEVTDGEVVVFHTSDDAFNNTADDRFRILPSNIYYNGTDYVIRIPYARLIKPSLWLTEYVSGDPQERKEYDKNNASNYVSSVDIYRVYNDTTNQGKIIGPPFDFSSNTTLQEQAVNIVILDEENAEFKIVESGSYATFEPTHVEVNCYVGYPLTEQNYMNPTIEEFILRRAKVDMGLNAKLAEAKISEMWAFDYLPAYRKPDENSSFGGVGFVPNPVGARNVDVEMFKKLMPISNYRGKILDQRFWIG